MNIRSIVLLVIVILLVILGGAFVFGRAWAKS
jgi:hypothetical protein